MKKTFLCIFTVIIFLCSFSHAVFAGNCDGWYVKRNGLHKQPGIDAQFSYIEELNGYYVDRKHGDECDEKVIYLTFDAGYENGNIEKILNVLKEENVTATFFVLEHLIRDKTELVKRMADEGHIVANHTMSHKDMTKVKKEEFRSELTGLENIYRETTGR